MSYDITQYLALPVPLTASVGKFIGENVFVSNRECPTKKVPPG